MPVMERIAPLETLTDQAHRSIKQYILGGSFSIDERLTESFFAEHLGISKSPVREALNALQNEGLLRIEPRKGIYLRRFTAKEISDLYELREALEVYATQIVPITAEFIEALEQSLERTTELLARDNKTAYIEEDIAFHRLIVVSTGNEQLSNTHSNIQDKLWLCRCQTYQLTSPDTPAAHHAIARALQAGDREAAATATRDHIRFVRDALLRSQNELDQESRNS
ncbi:GntR family transcriptional regulator [Terriglobus albidus]|uniref:GntR family transcriptional regulator n=1 Tax=Terriglobus albidus TaxID=1592106 RepID=UPI0021E02C70|nr:GntR family transcriptional regulator [Terriglobus albidus]